MLQYLFQCNCPASSEQAQYPKQVEVIVPACSNRGVKLSPSGRILYVQEVKSDLTHTYLVDLQTYEKIPFTLPNSDFYFLNDDLLYVFVYYEGDEYIFDRINQKKYPIQKFRYSRSDAQINGDTNLALLAESLRESDKVFFIDNGTDTVVALASDFRIYPAHNFLADRFDIPGDESNRMEQFLRENNIFHQTVPASFPNEMISPDGRFVARPDGVYLVKTGQKIVEGYVANIIYRPYSGKYFSVRGWTYDGTGVIYSKFLNPCLIETNFLVFDDVGCFYEVPQPVIKLKVPREYLLPEETP